MAVSGGSLPKLLIAGIVAAAMLHYFIFWRNFFKNNIPVISMHCYCSCSRTLKIIKQLIYRVSNRLHILVDTHSTCLKVFVQAQYYLAAETVNAHAEYVVKNLKSAYRQRGQGDKQIGLFDFRVLSVGGGVLGADNDDESAGEVVGEEGVLDS